MRIIDKQYACFVFYFLSIADVISFGASYRIMDVSRSTRVVAISVIYPNRIIYDILYFYHHHNHHCNYLYYAISLRQPLFKKSELQYLVGFQISQAKVALAFSPILSCLYNVVFFGLACPYCRVVNL
jgi:hypothetical protein